MVLIFDSTVLINLIDRCSVIDIIPMVKICGYDIHIVRTVYDEYLKGAQKYPNRVDIQRFERHIKSQIQVIDDNGFTLNGAVDLLSLDSGELMSVIYKKSCNFEAILCTDDLATHKMVERVLKKKCLWTFDLLLLLHQHDLSPLSQDEINCCYTEMIDNGFMGIPSSDLDLSKIIDLTEYT